MLSNHRRLVIIIVVHSTKFCLYFSQLLLHDLLYYLLLTFISYYAPLLSINVLYTVIITCPFHRYCSPFFKSYHSPFPSPPPFPVFTLTLPPPLPSFSTHPLHGSEGVCLRVHRVVDPGNLHFRIVLLSADPNSSHFPLVPEDTIGLKCVSL